MNIRCKLFGHKIIEPTSGVASCERCGKEWYACNNEWPSELGCYGYLGIVSLKLWRLVFRLTKWHRPKCDHCGKSLWFRKPYNDSFCNSECFSKWIPF